jgi:hypothetical protein
MAPSYRQDLTGGDLMARYSRPEPNEIILEFVGMGSVMRVSAMDPASLTEVVIQGPIGADQASLADLAKQKLMFMLAKKRGGR